MRQSKKLVHSLFLSTWNASFNVQLMLMLMSTTMMIKICKFTLSGFLRPFPLSHLLRVAESSRPQTRNSKSHRSPITQRAITSLIPTSPPLLHTHLSLSLCSFPITGAFPGCSCLAVQVRGFQRGFGGTRVQRHWWSFPGSWH